MGLVTSVVSIKWQATLGGCGLIHGVYQKSGYPEWAWPNLWCQSKGRLAWMVLANQWCQSKSRLAFLSLVSSMLSIKWQVDVD